MSAAQAKRPIVRDKAPGKSRQQQPVITWSSGVDPACRLDREADAELQAGHHKRAEFLASRAMALRGCS